MARQERNRMMLNTVDFKPAVFTPLERKPLDYDMGLLERSFALQDERRTKTEAQIASFKEATSKLRSQLHSSELAEFDNKVKELEDNINNAIAVGDYQGALNQSIHIAGDLISDPETMAKIKTNIEYEKGMAVLDENRNRGEISDNFYNYLKHINQYKFTPVYDDNGNVTGGDRWSLKFPKEIKWDEIVKKVLPTIAAEHSRKGYTSNVDSEGNVKNNTTSGSTERKTLDAERIVDSIWDYLIMDGYSRESLTATMESDLYAISQLNDENDNLSIKINELEAKKDIGILTSEEETQLNELRNKRKNNNSELGALNMFFQSVDGGLSQLDSYMLRTLNAKDNDFFKNMGYDYIFTDGSNIYTGAADEKNRMTLNDIQNSINSYKGTIQMRDSNGNTIDFETHKKQLKTKLINEGYDINDKKVQNMITEAVKSWEKEQKESKK